MKTTPSAIPNDQNIPISKSESVNARRLTAATETAAITDTPNAVRIGSTFRKYPNPIPPKAVWAIPPLIMTSFFSMM